eukprot:CAMPEP_0195096434 /NCGR_PEP_ID=MMETSP0448-20130528/51549_1 /TAXON_ID=66468 /ORGANISM="Heterocapsa triquestra, Strain CCMP 448" /LENGTH=559 /DNA_ID=CAMNT_0040130817 /DNA_START=65 /DNA_END=1744 /DNA_ORIENTATION=-
MGLCSSCTLKELDEVDEVNVEIGNKKGLDAVDEQETFPAPQHSFISDTVPTVCESPLRDVSRDSHHSVQKVDLIQEETTGISESEHVDPETAAATEEATVAGGADGTPRCVVPTSIDKVPFVEPTSMDIALPDIDMTWAEPWTTFEAPPPAVGAAAEEPHLFPRFASIEAWISKLPDSDKSQPRAQPKGGACAGSVSEETAAELAQAQDDAWWRLPSVGTWIAARPVPLQPAASSARTDASCEVQAVAGEPHLPFLAIQQPPIGATPATPFLSDEILGSVHEKKAPLLEDSLMSYGDDTRSTAVAVEMLAPGVLFVGSLPTTPTGEPATDCSEGAACERSGKQPLQLDESAKQALREASIHDAELEELLQWQTSGPEILFVGSAPATPTGGDPTPSIDVQSTPEEDFWPKEVCMEPLPKVVADAEKSAPSQSKMDAWWMRPSVGTWLIRRPAAAVRCKAEARAICLTGRLASLPIQASADFGSHAATHPGSQTACEVHPAAGLTMLDRISLDDLLPEPEVVAPATLSTKSPVSNSPVSADIWLSFDPLLQAGAPVRTCR